MPGANFTLSGECSFMYVLASLQKGSLSVRRVKIRTGLTAYCTVVVFYFFRKEARELREADAVEIARDLMA